MHRTVQYNFARALPFAQNATFTNLLGLRPGQPVGNWRDSNEGLGYGFYPFDVNTALVPASLRATQALVIAGVLSNTSLDATEVSAVANVWETHAPDLFHVNVDAQTAEQRLKNFVQAANLSQALLNQTNATSQDSVAFYALSLMLDGTPVQVMNSDTSFNLVYGQNVSQEFLQHVVTALQPYPRGTIPFIAFDRVDSSLSYRVTDEYWNGCRKPCVRVKHDEHRDPKHRFVPRHCGLVGYFLDL